eukprot:scaffold543_cov312-Prasinococcus_capsulatus_cf.AAC.2
MRCNADDAPALVRSSSSALCNRAGDNSAIVAREQHSHVCLGQTNDQDIAGEHRTDEEEHACVLQASVEAGSFPEQLLWSTTVPVSSDVQFTDRVWLPPPQLSEQVLQSPATQEIVWRLAKSPSSCCHWRRHRLTTCTSRNELGRRRRSSPSSRPTSLRPSRSPRWEVQDSPRRSCTAVLLTADGERGSTVKGGTGGRAGAARKACGLSDGKLRPPPSEQQQQRRRHGKPRWRGGAARSSWPEVHGGTLLSGQDILATGRWSHRSGKVAGRRP